MGKMVKDALGQRMKMFYEHVTRFGLPRRTYTVIRLDGKAFHSYTKGLVKPFDKDLMDDMDGATQFLCENIQGCKLAYVQSDEITLVLTDFDTIETEAWFKGNIQKMASISASQFTAKFNQLRTLRIPFLSEIREMKLACFDSRVFTISDVSEVINNIIWRQQDCIRNSVSSVAQANFSAKELHKVSRVGQLKMLKEKKGIDWDKDFSEYEKYGRLFLKQPKEVYIEKIDKTITRNAWTKVEPKVFSQDKSQLDFLRTIGK